MEVLRGLSNARLDWRFFYWRSRRTAISAHAPALLFLCSNYVTWLYTNEIPFKILLPHVDRIVKYILHLVLVDIDVWLVVLTRDGNMYLSRDSTVTLRKLPHQYIARLGL